MALARSRRTGNGRWRRLVGPGYDRRMTGAPQPSPEVLFVCVHNAGRSQIPPTATATPQPSPTPTEEPTPARVRVSRGS